MTTKLSLRFTHDAGHGWLRVERQHLIALGLAGAITQYSYQRGEFVFLEEDCDATLFVATARAAGWQVTWTERHCERSSIRTYDRYTAQ